MIVLMSLLFLLKIHKNIKEYLQLKQKLKQDDNVYNMLKDFKDKQNQVQISYLNGQDISKEKQEEMENLYFYSYTIMMIVEKF